MTTNEDLQSRYEAGYATGNTWHTPVDTREESNLICRLGGNWHDKTVLEIGCGEGLLAALIAESGAYAVTAIDYSPAATATARQRHDYDNLLYMTGTVADLGRMRFDVIVMQGVLEHMDDPWERLQEYVRDHLNPGGSIITSSPSFLNPRGYVWQTLRLLLGVPMSLSDLHAINVFDMIDICFKNNWQLYYESCHYDWAHGREMIEDYKHRLPNALRDAGLDVSRVDDLLDWLSRAGQHSGRLRHSGATMVYKIMPR